MRASIAMVLLLSLLSGCGMAPKGSAAAHGVPIDPGPKPSGAECAAMIRVDLVTAKRIRAGMELPWVPSDDAAVEAAASDSDADLEALGIPLRPDELRMIRAGGIALSAHERLNVLVHTGAPERFGGMWIDPPGTDRYVVAVMGPDPATLARARCVEGDNTNYVTARLSIEEGTSIQERIDADWQALAVQGIRLASTSYDETKGIVIVGVTGLTEAIRLLLIERYGDVVVEEQAPALGL